MPVEFTMPKLGLTMEEGTILSWLVDDGAAVTTGMPVMVIETDKTETEVEVNGSGVFHYAASIGDTLRCGEVIALLLADGEAMPVMSVPPPVSAPASDIPPPPLPTTADIVDATAADRLVASPNARRIADELGVDLGTVRGTGPGGRITSEDVHDAAAMSIAEPAETAGATTSGVTGSPSAKLSSQLASEAGQVDTASNSTVVASLAARQLADLLGVDLRAIRADPTEGRVTRDGVAAHVRLRLAAANAPSGSGGTGGVGGGALLQTPSATVAMTGMRGTIAKRMHSSLRDMAQLTLTMDAAMDAVVVDRTKRRKRAEESDEPIPGYTDYVIAAVARALRAHPRVNSQVANDEIVVLPDIHVGLAVALDEGLLVPVVRHADRMALPDLADETSRLARAARARTLALADMEGGTFSVTALGMFGVDAFTPVVNPPNAAILGVGRLRDEVVARKGKVSTVKQLTLSLTWDHRVFDGAPAAEFTRTIVELLAEPGDLA
jgi:pyruvate dehydrogenase E2 component (dihydrolipoamide acetyltransferase)